MVDKQREKTVVIDVKKMWRVKATVVPVKALGAVFQVSEWLQYVQVTTSKIAGNSKDPANGPSSSQASGRGPEL